jgi:integrase
MRTLGSEVVHGRRGRSATGRSRTKSLAARLGHADPSITLRVYAHVISNQLAEAADIFAQVMKAAG